MVGPRFLPHLVLVGLIVIWSGSFVVSKAAMAQLAPFGLIATRFWLAALCVLPFACRPGAAAALRSAVRPGLLAGVALAGGYLMQMVGLRETSASMSGLIAGLIVPFVAVGGFVFFRARVGWRGAAGLLLAIAGMVAICWPQPANLGEPPDTLRGILLQVGSSASYAAHVLLLLHFGRHVPLAALTLVQMVVVGALGTIATVLTGEFAADPAGAVDWNTTLVLAVGYLGVLSTAFAIGLQAKVQPQIHPTHVALLFTLQPLFAAVLGRRGWPWVELWDMPGDALSVMQMVGGGLIVLGVVISSTDR
jgi:drug/metabolite transporter (DMT)-like permease